MLAIELVGAGRVAFSSRVSFMSAVSCRFFQITYMDIDKKVGFFNTGLLYSFILSLPIVSKGGSQTIRA